MNYIYDTHGIKRKLSDLNAVEHLFSLKSKHQTNPWPVIEACIKIWEDSNPKEWKSFLYEIRQTQETRRDKFASSDPKKDKRYGGILRYTLDIPEKVMYMIRCIYSVEELPMNSTEFVVEWAKRFPKMKVASKI